MLPVALRDTGLLMLSVGILTSCAGLVAAWLVSHYEFPGRRFFEWALILPLAVPTYLAAYSYVEFLGFTGPLQQLVRALNDLAEEGVNIEAMPSTSEISEVGNEPYFHTNHCLVAGAARYEALRPPELVESSERRLADDQWFARTDGSDRHGFGETAGQHGRL